MNRKMLASLAVSVAALLMNVPAKAADAVAAESATFTNSRTDSVSYISSKAYYRGTSLVFTNCRCLTSGGATQGLDSVAIEVKIGNTSSNNIYAGVVTSASNGLWASSFVVPTNMVDPYIQVKLTDISTNVYIYPWKQMRTQVSL